VEKNLLEQIVKNIAVEYAGVMITRNQKYANIVEKYLIALMDYMCIVVIIANTEIVMQ